ncbi:MAG: AmmeMemoRadiSam system protein A [Candidatus Thermoplasmatota archaeon]|nr:AmmeMemoRadiSam system protein A [Candidatus Thermoplasmatota archaeon]
MTGKPHEASIIPDKIEGEDTGSYLKKLARRSIEAHFTGESFKDEAKEGSLDQKTGVFVTLRKSGELRGCIGFPLPRYSIRDGVRKAAIFAATEDPRFPRVKKDEMKDIEIEVSLLTPPEDVEIRTESDLARIKVGRDGLIVSNDYTSGLLLPQVATEYNLTAREFIEATCEKAGLPRGEWKRPGVRIQIFRAVVFE